MLQRTDTVNAVISDWLTMIIEFTAVCWWENLELFQKKFISVPRLELTAAVLSMKMACLLKKELDINFVDEVFWTDSKVILGCITNTVKRFKTFFANRVQQTKEKTDVQQWHYVPTKENPADDASRGLNAAKGNSSSRWFQGPRFLWQEDKIWEKQTMDKSYQKMIQKSERISKYVLSLRIKAYLLICQRKYPVGAR